MEFRSEMNKKCEETKLLIYELRKIFPDETVVFEKDFRDDVKISRESTRKFAHKIRGSVRIVLGFYKTKDEYEEWRKQVLTSKLP